MFFTEERKDGGFDILLRNNFNNGEYMLKIPTKVVIEIEKDGYRGIIYSGNDILIEFSEEKTRGSIKDYNESVKWKSDLHTKCCECDLEALSCFIDKVSLLNCFISSYSSGVIFYLEEMHNLHNGDDR